MLLVKYPWHKRCIEKCFPLSDYTGPISHPTPPGAR